MTRRAYRYRIYPTKDQERQFWQFAAGCRLVYNLALEQRRDFWRQYLHDTGMHISLASQCRELTSLRADFDWISSTPSNAQVRALRDLDRAFRSFFRGNAEYPRMRKKGVHESFRFQAAEVDVCPLNRKWAKVRLPKIGWVKFRSTRAMLGKLRTVTVSHDRHGWYVAFSTLIEHEAPASIAPAVGIDRGVVNTIALSTGERLSLPATVDALERKKRKAQRVLNRRKRGSVRYTKSRKRVAAIRAREARIRKDWLHRVTTGLARQYGTVFIEDLNTRGMTAKGKGKRGLNRSILMQGWHMFETLLAYKLEERGGELIKVPPHYTSCTCSECGAVDARSRKSQATFDCVHCGHHANADTNAAINILRRNTAAKLVDKRHWPLGEARTGELVAHL